MDNLVKILIDTEDNKLYNEKKDELKIYYENKINEVLSDDKINIIEKLSYIRQIIDDFGPMTDIFQIDFSWIVKIFFDVLNNKIDEIKIILKEYFDIIVNNLLEDKNNEIKLSPDILNILLKPRYFSKYDDFFKNYFNEIDIDLINNKYNLFINNFDINELSFIKLYNKFIELSNKYKKDSFNKIIKVENIEIFSEKIKNMIKLNQNVNYYSTFLNEIDCLKGICEYSKLSKTINEYINSLLNKEELDKQFEKMNYSLKNYELAKTFDAKTYMNNYSENGFKIFEKVLNDIINTRYNEIYFRKMFKILMEISEIVEKKRFEDLLINIFNIYSKMIYDSYKMTDDQTSNFILFVSKYEEYEIRIRKILLLTKYINEKNNGKDSKVFNELSNKIFYELFEEIIKNKIMKTFFELLNDDRNNNIELNNLLKRFIRILYELIIFNNSIKLFIDNLTEHYDKEIKTKYMSYSCNEYFNKVNEIIIYENKLIENYYADIIISIKNDENSEKNKHKKNKEKPVYIDEEINKKLNELFLKFNSNNFLTLENSGINYLLNNDKYDILNNIYKLFNRYDEGPTTITDYLVNNIKTEGKRFINDDKNHIELIDKILEFYQKYKKIYEIGFENDKKYINSTHKGFDFINNNSKISEYISLYIDEKLQSNFKGKSDEEIENIFSDISNLLRFVQDKDLFEKYYRQHLAKRLIVKKNTDDDHEKMFIFNIKPIFEKQFITKVENMFNDVQISDNLNSEFKKYIEENSIDLKHQFNVYVLTSGSWPIPEGYKVNLPSELQFALNSYEKFYMKMHNGRKLTWNIGMGFSAEIKYIKKYEILMNNYQMIISLLFNEHEIIKYNEIREKTLIRDIDIKKSLLPLIAKKILNKTGDSKKFDEDDEFSINPKFTSKTRKVKLGIINQKETKEENKETLNKISEERNFVIDAIIVRIMKTRKQLEHSNLIVETTEQLSNRFIPDIKQIKKRIESLIEREYLQRMEGQNTYQYLA